MSISLRRLLSLLALWPLLAAPAQAKHRETGFLDRTITLQGVNYKYQVYVPKDWTPHKKWPIILSLHGAGERGDDGIQQTDVGIGTAIRATANKLAKLFYRLITRGEAYRRDSGEAEEIKQRERQLKALQRKAQELGMQVIAKVVPA